MSNIVKLNLASGQRPKDGYINIDAVAHNNKTTVCDVLDLTKIGIENKSIDEVFSEHFIEHIDKNEIKVFMKECNRVLKKGGTLMLIAPSFELAIHWCFGLKNKDFPEKPQNPNPLNVGWLEDILYSTHVHKHDYHKQGYYPDKLVALMTEYGFATQDFGYKVGSDQAPEIYIKAIKE